MQKVRSQRLTMFLQTAQNPAVAPFVKMSKLISELAFSLDLDPEEILNSPEEAAIAAQIIGMQNAQQTTGEETAPTGQPPTGMEALQEHLNHQKNLIVQGLVVATSEQELFLNRGKWALVETLSN